ncbi:MAG: PqqD family peptide modification chaperone [Lachnospiraceae bacterium]|jgi:hypothetical protein|nr:PqqD family peptide modification chaperone [Lachnospiraceae bacterium]
MMHREHVAGYSDCRTMCDRLHCGAGIEHITVDTDGDIYICDRLYGHNEYVMGQDVLLIDNRNNRIIVINVTCAFILREFQEIQDVQEVINSAISFFEGDAETIRNDIEKIIIQLVEEKILCEAVTE